jgi:hypothetical protein
MPDQSIITGTITPTDGLDRRGIKIQVFDRDLPSLERRLGGGPLLLGEAVTDAGGRFQISYTLDPFSRGEGIPLLQRSREKRVDISFSVFAQDGQALTLHLIEALDREFAPDQIIFNIPAQLNVNLVVDAPQPAVDSEYEQLIALITPVVEDLPLAELRDEDIAFLVSELGFEQPETHARLQWLRGSALLATETELPIEAFYGWGREDMPARLVELAALPLSDLEVVLKKLADIPADQLHEALRKAIDETIIPVSLRDRIDAIILRLKRRNQVLHAVTARLQNAETNVALAGYSVTTLDQDTGDNRGQDITDNAGTFSFDFYQPPDLPADAPTRRFLFQVVTPTGEAIAEGEPTSIDLNQTNGDVIPIRIKLPKPERPAFEEQLQQAEIPVPPELLEWLRAKGIGSFKDIRISGGLLHAANLPQVDPDILRALDSFADLDRVAFTVSVSKVLRDRGYDSVLAIADTPYSEFTRNVSPEATALTAVQVAKMHVMATVQTNLLNTLLTGMAADAANGFSLPAADPIGDR